MVNTHARAAIARLYEDTCTVYELTQIKDADTKITSGAQWEPVYEEIICRLSYKDVAAVVQGAATGKVVQAVKLYLSPDIRIRPGSRIAVTHCGETVVYKNSGEPSIYGSHQEVALERPEGRA
jgi:hypothetical protein